MIITNPAKDHNKAHPHKIKSHGLATRPEQAEPIELYLERTDNTWVRLQYSIDEAKSLAFDLHVAAKQLSEQTGQVTPANKMLWQLAARHSVTETHLIDTLIGMAYCGQIPNAQLNAELWAKRTGERKKYGFAFLTIDYDELKPGSYRKVKLTTRMHDGYEVKHTFATGNVVTDYRDACAAAVELADEVYKSSTVDHFVSDHNEYKFQSTSQGDLIVTIAETD